MDSHPDRRTPLTQIDALDLNAAQDARHTANLPDELPASEHGRRETETMMPILTFDSEKPCRRQNENRPPLGSPGTRHGHGGENVHRIFGRTRNQRLSLNPHEFWGCHLKR